MRRINLTQHDALPEQGCLPRTDADAAEVATWLTFNTLPSLAEIVGRAQILVDIAVRAGADEAMIGGAPYLMVALDPALRMAGITPIYAFSLRQSVDERQPDGSVVKRTKFRHLGFVRLER